MRDWNGWPSTGRRLLSDDLTYNDENYGDIEMANIEAKGELVSMLPMDDAPVVVAAVVSGGARNADVRVSGELEDWISFRDLFRSIEIDLRVDHQRKCSNECTWFECDDDASATGHECSDSGSRKKIYDRRTTWPVCC